MPGRDLPADQSHRFLLLYALAWAGGAIAYTPLLTLILPVKVIALAGGGSAVAWLSAIAFSGAVSASISNIGFGWLSDKTGHRRGWIAAGLIGTSAILPMLGWAQTLGQIIAVIVGWQIALNMMLAPLAAWAGDHVPDHQKGRLGGLMAFAPAMGAVSGALVTWPGLVPDLAGEQVRLWAVALLVLVCVAPVVLLGKPRVFAELMAPKEGTAPADHDGEPYAVARMWFARFLIQISEAAIFAFLLIWLQSIDSRIADSHVARLFGLVLVIAVFAALIVGRWADRARRPILPLRAGAGVAAVGLLLMAFASNAEQAAAGYIVFGVAGAVFLSMHAAQTLRVLPRPQHRGRDLGIFNLTNTIPSLVMPGIALALIPVFGFQGMFLVLAALALMSALVLAAVRRKVMPA